MPDGTELIDGIDEETTVDGSMEGVVDGWLDILGNVLGTLLGMDDKALLGAMLGVNDGAKQFGVSNSILICVPVLSIS